jgi:hypothetical protein
MSRVAPGLHTDKLNMNRRATLLCLLFVFTAMGAAPARARPFFKRGKVQARVKLIRSGIQQHQQLRSTMAPVAIAKSKILKNSVASAKKYGDSWTCRTSTELLIKQLGNQGIPLKMDSVGKNAFNWGKEGKVSYHYFGVDNPRRPTVLLDPTASTNFAQDVQPGGMMLGLLQQAGRQLGQPRAAERVARRIARGGVKGLLVLANKAEIDVYRRALDDAAKKQVQVTRNQERAQATPNLRFENLY